MIDFDMTPYAAFVWPAWGISALVLAALVVRALAASRRWGGELKRLEADMDPATRTGRVEVEPDFGAGAAGPTP